MKKIVLFSKYTLISLITLGISLFLVWWCTDILGVYYLLSCVIGFIVANFASFFMNRFWTFRSHVGPYSGLIRSLFVALVVLTGILVAMHILVEIL